MKTVDKIRAQLESISNELSQLIREASIKRMDRSRNVRVIAPEYYWGELNAEQKNDQIRLKRKYDRIAEVISALLRNAPKDIAKEVTDSDKRYRMWLEFESNWSLKPSSEENELRFKEDIEAVYKIISILSSGKDDDEIVIPDTNSIMFNPDPTSYRSLVGSGEFKFLLLPTVLNELDELKILHRNPDVREKANKCIKRIKGWRSQGSLQEGVTVDSNIKISAAYQEPDMDNTLSWLDRENCDDRIVASILAVQAEYPNSKVLLVTGDINLQNKADAAFIEVNEI